MATPRQSRHGLVLDRQCCPPLHGLARHAVVYAVGVGSGRVVLRELSADRVSLGHLPGHRAAPTLAGLAGQSPHQLPPDPAPPERRDHEYTIHIQRGFNAAREPAHVKAGEPHDLAVAGLRHQTPEIGRRVMGPVLTRQCRRHCPRVELMLDLAQVSHQRQQPGNVPLGRTSDVHEVPVLENLRSF
jgi:hypothetical protein